MKNEKFKTIGITGGKGGVGKSTFSLLLANRLRNQGKKVVLVDCDVECPNDHLLLGKKLEKPINSVSAQFPKLDKKKCQKCGLCVRNCRSNAIFQAPGKHPVFIHELCSGCGLCWHLCPHKAIKIEKKTIGEIFINKFGRTHRSTPTKRAQSVGVDQCVAPSTKALSLVTGRSVGVVEETGPIVTETRKVAKKVASEIKADYLLIDTAVGMHCGVIRALIDCDLVYAVTEPTPLGAHDLELTIKLLEKLKLPAKIVINQANLGEKKKVEKIAKSYTIEIKYKIPYSQQLVKAYSHGKMGEINIL